MSDANHRKHNDGSHNSSTYHKKDGTSVRAILKREATEEIEDALESALQDVRELIQDDLLTCLDSMPNKVKTDVCEIVVQRFKPLLET